MPNSYSSVSDREMLALLVQNAEELCDDYETDELSSRDLAAAGANLAALVLEFAEVLAIHTEDLANLVEECGGDDVRHDTTPLSTYMLTLRAALGKLLRA